MLTLTSRIEFVKFMKERFIGNSVSIEFISVIECTIDFGIVENIDVADDKVSVWGGEIGVFWINLDDIIAINYDPKDEDDVCVQIEAKNRVKINFSLA